MDPAESTANGPQFKVLFTLAPGTDKSCAPRHSALRPSLGCQNAIMTAERSDPMTAKPYDSTAPAAC